MRARTTDRGCGGFMRESAVANQLVQRFGFFQRVEIGALDVLDQRHRHRALFVERFDDGRHAFQTGLLGRAPAPFARDDLVARSEEHTSELQSLMRISYAVFCLKKKKNS